MAKNSIRDFDNTAGNNTDIQSVDIAENCAPSGINNAIRELMADMADVNDGTVALVSPAMDSADINGGTIDGTVIGGTTPAAGTFTTGDFNTSLNVDGTITSDGLTVDGATVFDIGDEGTLQIGPTTTVADENQTIEMRGSNGSNELQRFQIANRGEEGRVDFKYGRAGATPTKAISIGAGTGDISFYEDTGTTAKLFWDASAEALGIGTTSPSGQDISANNLVVEDSSGNGGITIKTPTTSYGSLHFSDGTGVSAYRGILSYNHSDDSMQFSTNSTERLRLNSTGNLLLRQTSDAVYDTNGAGSVASYYGAQFSSAQSTATKTILGNAADGNYMGSATNNSSGNAIINGYVRAVSTVQTAGSEEGILTFATKPSGSSATEHMRLTSDGNLLVGETSTPADVAGLYVKNTDPDDNYAGQLGLKGTATSGAADTGAAIAFEGHNGSGNRSLGQIAVLKENSTVGNNNSYMRFSTRKNPLGNTERMRLTSDGNLGIGETDPQYQVQLSKGNAGGVGPVLYLKNDVNSASVGHAAEIRFNLREHEATSRNALIRAEAEIAYGASPALTFHTSSGNTGEPEERLRIDSSGRLLIDGDDVASAANGAYVDLRGGDGTSISTYRIGTATRTHHAFYNGTSSSRSLVGTIQTSGSSTSYNTSSDYRLKENVTGITDGIERVKQLNPSRFNFIADADKTVDGFLAHEVSDIVPEAITGEKDAMRDEEYEVTPAVYEDVVIPAVLDDDGNEIEAERTEQQLVTEAVMGTRSVPDYQGIDQSKLVPLLTAALQEAIAKIETLEAKVTALENA